ncbi:hypothetical protein ACJIZ3_011114 [Penstemon smallii]|uniref:TF-B3 domain-containing protein n=1 Tax=Penstemon smallii TaxID=265156 RepID=A0ABD3ULV5_9LAMI
MAPVNYALGMRFFVQISKSFKKNPKFEIPQGFMHYASHELGHITKGSVRIRKRVYQCSIVHSGGGVFIDGKEIAKLAYDFNIKSGDVVFFEYLGNGYFAGIVCCGTYYMEKKSVGCHGTPVRFFVEALSYDGVDLPDLLFSFVNKDTYAFFRVQTRLGTWQIEHISGSSRSMLGGSCWHSFHVANKLRSSIYLQMDYHGAGKFTATAFKSLSSCEQPLNLSGKLFVKAEEGTSELKCMCNRPTPLRHAAANIASEDDMGDNTLLQQNVIDSWNITAKKHMVPQACRKTLPRMYLPTTKWKKHHLDKMKVVVITVESCTRGRWEVMVRPYKQNGKTDRVALTQGWSKFASETNLGIGAKTKVNLLSPPHPEPSNGQKLYMSMSFN